MLLNAVAQLALKASINNTGEIDLALSGSASTALRQAAEPWLWVGLFCY